MRSLTASIPASKLAKITALCDAGRYLSAHALAVSHCDELSAWTGGVAALLIAGKIAGNLGGERLSRLLILRAGRNLRTDPEATLEHSARVALSHGRQIFVRRGPFALRQFLLRLRIATYCQTAGSDTLRAELLCLRAHVAASYRDTDAAESLWQEARSLTPARPWIWTERASLLVKADRFDEALEAAREALRLEHRHHPALLMIASVLTLLGKDEEAASLLEAALNPSTGGMESAPLAARLSEIYREMRRSADTLRCLDLFESFAPLIEEPGRRWLHSRRCEARLQANDLTGAVAAAQSIAGTSKLYAKTAERLREPELAAARRVHLDVPYVRQHEKTCAPATLAALTRFWRKPADQADIAREICHGGTFDHRERHWAETRGWVVREFRADWTSSVALLDAGIPFALTTAWINSGHLQAVTGYDARRGTIVVRDPFERNNNEMLAEEFFQHYAFCGPRAMAFVPADNPRAISALLAATLPESSGYDDLYQLRRALRQHDRHAGDTALAALSKTAPDTRLHFLARREMAIYDGDDSTALEAVEGLIVKHAGEGRLRLEKYYLLHRLARPHEARRWLEKCLADPALSEPNLWRELARELRADASQRPRARQCLMHALFHEPTEGQHLHLLAELQRDAGNLVESAALLRLAACAAVVREDYWWNFFLASQCLRETDVALNLLETRSRQLRDFSSHPERTLHRARWQGGEFTLAEAVLAGALERRPEDGELLIYAASSAARNGEHDKATDLLARASCLAAPRILVRATAELADLRGDLDGAMTHWRKLLTYEPLDSAAHAAIVHSLAAADPRGRAAAREHLDQAVGHYPQAAGLHVQRVEFFREDPGRGSADHLGAVDALLAVQPANAWAHRERALAYQARGDFPAAANALNEAERLDPLAASTHAIRGRFLLAAGEDYPTVRASLRRALELDVDLTVAFISLLEASPTAGQKRESLDFVRREMLRQPVNGEGLLIYREAAGPLLTNDELRSQLDEAVATRPDLWHAWSAAARQHAEAGCLETSRAYALEAASKAPSLPRVWIDLAHIENLLGNDSAEKAALERASRLGKSIGVISRNL